MLLQVQIYPSMSLYVLTYNNVSVYIIIGSYISSYSVCRVIVWVMYLLYLPPLYNLGCPATVVYILPREIIEYLTPLGTFAWGEMLEGDEAGVFDTGLPTIESCCVAGPPSLANDATILTPALIIWNKTTRSRKIIKIKYSTKIYKLYRLQLTCWSRLVWVSIDFSRGFWRWKQTKRLSNSSEFLMPIKETCCHEPAGNVCGIQWVSSLNFPAAVEHEFQDICSRFPEQKSSFPNQE